MKIRSCLRLLVGVLLGFTVGRMLAPSGVYHDMKQRFPRTQAPPISVAGETHLEDHVLKLSGGTVRVARDSLESLARETLSARMHMDDVESGSLSCVDSVFTWVPMTEDEKSQLKDVLQQAAHQRRQWEIENVTSRQVGAAEWIVSFPGDGGLARQDLRSSIQQIFGPERAEQIEILADPSGFFGMKWLAPGFKQGEIRIRAMEVKSLLKEQPIRLSVEIDGKGSGLHLFTSMGIPLKSKRSLPAS